MPLTHILQESDNEHIAKLSHCITNEDLAVISEVKGDDDLIVCKLDHHKVISWLEKKVNIFFNVVLGNVKTKDNGF